MPKRHNRPPATTRNQECSVFMSVFIKRLSRRGARPSCPARASSLLGPQDFDPELPESINTRRSAIVTCASALPLLDHPDLLHTIRQEASPHPKGIDRDRFFLFRS